MASFASRRKQRAAPEKFLPVFPGRSQLTAPLFSDKVGPFKNQVVITSRRAASKVTGVSRQ